MSVDTCPQCNLPLPRPRPALCPRCKFALVLAEGDDSHEGVAHGLHRPTGPAQDDRTRPVPVQERSSYVPSQQPGPGQICPSCQWRNPPDRRRCERCAAMLGSQPVRPGPPPPPVPPPTRGGLRWWMIAIPVAAVLVLGLAAAYVFLPGRTGGGPLVTPRPSGTTATTSRPGSLALNKIESGTVQAAASSTRPPGDGLTYAAGNTLDGKLTTGWNSDGAAGGSPVTLTFTFADSVRLGRIDFANGFQAGPNAYARNRRVKKLTVTADGAERTFDVTDTKDYQPLDFDFGATRKVVLRIDDTYPGSRYNDVAISEVVFHRLG